MGDSVADALEGWVANRTAQSGEHEVAEEPACVTRVHLVLGNRLGNRKNLREGRLLDLLRRAQECAEEGVDDAGLDELAHAHCGEGFQYEAPYLRHVLESRYTGGRPLLDLVRQRAAFHALSRGLRWLGLIWLEE